MNSEFDAGGTLELSFAAAAFRLALPCLHRRHASAAVGQRERERAAADYRCSHLRSEGGTPTPPCASLQNGVFIYLFYLIAATIVDQTSL